MIIVLLVVALLIAAVAIRARAPQQPSGDRRPELSPERRLWAIWKRLSLSDRLTIVLLVVAVLVLVPLALFALVVAMG